MKGRCRAVALKTNGGKTLTQSIDGVVARPEVCVRGANQEFLASISKEHVIWPQVIYHMAGESGQDPITDRMPVTIVHVFEPV